ncbi:hypothetical protein J4E08_22685 [Sagittula sp. NFXS13]|uniref:hypothetical protein n=1 Tax=Sagittula sp. NFXS13 TaxID=2819095 RepID=UPI0032E03AB2
MSDSRLERASYLSQIVSVITVIFGLGLAVTGVYTERAARKERYTFDYVDRYVSEDLREKRNLIREALSRTEAASGARTLGNYELSVLFADRVSEPSAGALRFALVSVFDFFSGAETCVNAGLCDVELVRAMVGDEARSLACLIAPAADRITLTGGRDSLLSGLRFVADDDPCA